MVKCLRLLRPIGTYLWLKEPRVRRGLLVPKEQLERRELRERLGHKGPKALKVHHLTFA